MHVDGVLCMKRAGIPMGPLTMRASPDEHKPCGCQAIWF